MGRLDDVRARLVRQFREALAERLRGLGMLSVALEAGDSDAAESIRRIAHQLRGSGASYGFPDISAAGALVEDADEAELSARLARLVEVVATHADIGGTSFGVRLVGADVGLRRALEVAGVPAGGSESDLVAVVAADTLQASRALRGVLADRSFAPMVLVCVPDDGATVATELVASGADAVIQGWRSESHLALEISRWHLRQVRRLRAAETDRLTGLLDRAGLRRRFDALRGLGAPCEVAILDLDRFKAINDRFGHDTGDQVLAKFAARLRRVLRATDTPGRWGGEEFVVLFSTDDVSHALDALRRVVSSLEDDPVQIEGHGPLVVRFSGGLVSRQQDEVSLDDVVARADELLLAAKGAGRNRILTEGGGAERTARRVLVVEDDEPTAELVCSSLAAIGLSTTHQSDGRAALRLCEEHRFDLVVLDLGLPGAGGIEVLRTLRADRRWATTPILVLTAATGDDTVESVFEAGGDDYVSKPFSSRQLVARVQRMLTR